jgi:DNA-binding Lrp family transcriptional regulator
MGTVLLQDRDTLLIRLLAEDFRLLTREQIGELIPMGSVSRLNYRLKKLLDGGYLSRRVLLPSSHSAGYAYFLGPQAAAVFDDPAERRVVQERRAQAAHLSDAGLAHRILVDSVHIRFLAATRSYPNYKLVTWVDQYSPWWEEVRHYGVPIQADGYAEYLMLMYFDSLFTFFLEVDRGTERGQVMQAKIARYTAFAASGTFERKFAASAFRVLFVTTSERRAHALAAMSAPDAQKVFWITSWEHLKQARLFDRYWMRPGLDGLHSLADHS